MSGLLAALAEGRVESVTSELRRLTDAAGGVHSRAVGVQGPRLASAPSELCDSCVPRYPDLSFLSVQTLSGVARTQENLQARDLPIPWEHLAQLLLRRGSHTALARAAPETGNTGVGLEVLSWSSFLFKAVLAAPGDNSWSSGPINLGLSQAGS
ncbi:unnamed protein product [Rangifer tarandus platyrhynchus]|uniref:Uncharacterized protein n=2 Tax=Rangifer tarandus platyrhynchus TaxID=3082113 RepID=A0ACB0DWK6_RANTA|nr:unnamed protein product [Rangifer tarandus platyrhynchus]CAI9692687.1 unnamed protein product [Rangifer tarandus platyrhynchus]